MSNNNIVLDVIEQEGKLKVILPEARISAVQAAQPGPAKAPFPRYEEEGYEWAPWGHHDNLPSYIRQEIAKVTMASSATEKLTKMMYGNGLVYVKDEDLNQGTAVKRHRDQKIENWLFRNRIHTHWLPAQIIDYRYYMNCFSEMILNGFGNEITGIYHKQAEFTRLERQNKRSMKIDNLLFSYEFKEGRRPSPSERVKIALYDWTDPERFFKKLGQRRKFAWHSFFPTPGVTYYARPFWIGLFRKGGWIEVAKNVPEIIAAMQNNQVRIKYQIIIPETYFEIRHTHKWDAYTFEERNKIIDAFIAKLEKALVGTDNAAKTISTIVRQDKVSGEMLGEIKIVAIDDKIKTGAWVPDSNTADAQIVQGLGLHPSQMGLQPAGGKMGAGSGSDQRESYNTQISTNTIDQNIILEPLNYISKFNGWGVTFMIDHTQHTTTNDQESGMKPSSTTTTIVD